MRKVLSLFSVLAFLGAGSLRAEMRGAWVASVVNIDFPSSAGLSSDEQKRQIIQILDTARRAKLNTLLVQVRPECDALYESGLEPWSRYLTGVQGRSPGYDPLAYFIAEGRRRGIAIHAWINPYRAAMNAGADRSSKHVASRYPSGVRRLKRVMWLDPGLPEVQDHVVAVVRDIVKRYPVAGIHLDDYFYPYPELYSGSFPDDATYARYRARGGTLGKGDWRRANVNSLVKRLAATVHATRPGALFGISPFGIYTKGQPSTVRAGLDQLNELYADPVAWLQQGWVDYLAPQLYWKDGGPQSFSELLKWWRSPGVNPHGIPIYPGIDIERLSEGWPASEIAHQMSVEKSIRPRGPGGFFLWNFKPLLKNQKGIRDVVASH